MAALVRPLLLVQLVVASLSLIIPSQIERVRENTEVHVDVPVEGEVRFYHRVKDPNAPFFMTISPCGGAVHWQIYNVLSKGFFPAGDLSTDPDVKLIAGQQKSSRMKYYSHLIGAERLLIVLRAPKAASVRLFVAYSQRAVDEQYPPLPQDTRLAQAVALQGDSASALLSWKSAGRVRKAKPGKYRICAVVSRKENEYAMCDHLQDGLESIHCVEGNKKQMRIDRLRPGTTYFVSLFVRDSESGAASPYSMLRLPVPSAFATKLSTTTETSQDMLLHDGILMTGQLPEGKGAMLGYDFIGNRSEHAKRILLVVHSCLGFVRVHVFRNGRLLKRSEPFSGFRRFLVLNAAGGRLRFEVVNEEGAAKSVRLWASSHASRSPYPLLPDDTSVRVSRRACGSATLQWFGAPDEDIEYCLYRRPESARFLEHLISRVDDLCTSGLSSELVGCYSPHGARKTRDLRLGASSLEDESNGLIETTVDGLRTDSTYRFDLLARPLRRPNSQFLPYRTVWVRTVKSC